MTCCIILFYLLIERVGSPGFRNFSEHKKKKNCNYFIIIVKRHYELNTFVVFSFLIDHAALTTLALTLIYVKCLKMPKQRRTTTVPQSIYYFDIQHKH